MNLNKSIYKYILEYNESRILEETLIKNDTVLYSITEGTINDINIPNTDIETLKFIFNSSCLDSSDNGKKEFILTFLSRLKLTSPNLNKDINAVFQFFSGFCVLPYNQLPYSLGIDLLNKFVDGNNGFERISTLLQKFDIGIEKMFFNRTRFELNKDLSGTIVVKDGQTWVDSVDTIHTDDKGNQVTFKIRDESFGTQTLFGLIGVILNVLDNGRILFIDELDRTLHFLIVNKIIQLFKSKAYNKKQAQLVCTVHSTDIMEAELMRSSEIIIVEKNKKEGSIATKFDIRNVINLRLQYIHGALGGLPHLHM